MGRNHNEDVNAPKYSVKDPALLGQAPGDGEQTISKISSHGGVEGKFFCCESSSVGRAQPCQGWGREFESRLSLKIYFLI